MARYLVDFYSVQPVYPSNAQLPQKIETDYYGAMPGYKTIVLASLFQKTPCFFRSTLWGFDDAESLAGKKSFFLSRLIFRNVNGYLALNSSFANSWQNIFGNFNIFQSFQG
jgi:hypothetical protein